MTIYSTSKNISSLPPDWISILRKIYTFSIEEDFGSLGKSAAGHVVRKAPRLKSARSQKYHDKTDWLRMLCFGKALYSHLSLSPTLICLFHLSASGRYRLWENIKIEVPKGHALSQLLYLVEAKWLWRFFWYRNNWLAHWDVHCDIKCAL